MAPRDEVPASIAAVESITPAVVAGGGIAGLVLALSLQARLGITPVVYEQAPEFRDGVGGAIGMYANGLRVIRDVDDGKLLSKLREAGYEYVWRRWYDHDGREVCKAEERHLVGSTNERWGEDEEELQSIGIRRWKLQRILYDACVERGIPVHFGKRIESVGDLPDGTVELGFAGSGDTVRAGILFGCDGVNSNVRRYVLGEESSGREQPEYTGVTCLMGSSPIPSPERGICFPSSNTTKCHMCTYPTGPEETIFQMYFPTPVENPESWGALGEEGGRRERDALAEEMVSHRWSERFVNTVAKAEPASIVRVGLRAREPLSRWARGNVVLLGDAAHPPVPYIGQGAMMAVEDAGTLALLLQKVCKGEGPSGELGLKRVPEALRLYQSIRVPRTASVLGKSRVLGKTQQSRAESKWYAAWREVAMKLQILWHGTLPIMMQGPRYDYRWGVEEALEGVGFDGKEAEEGGEGGVLGCGGQENAGKQDALEAVTVAA